jgi:hypothetical protein
MKCFQPCKEAGLLYLIVASDKEGRKLRQKKTPGQKAGG